jgi:cyanophycin synthetase
MDSYCIVFFILLLALLICHKNSERMIVFNSDKLQKYYDKNGIKFDEKNKFLIKGDKKIYYPDHFNTPKSIKLSDDKYKTKKILINYGFPTPKYYKWNARYGIKYNMKNIGKLNKPLVIKPINGTYGRNVMMNIIDDEVAFKVIMDLIETEGNDILIEEQVRGNVYRILVFNDTILSAYIKEPPYVTGTGIHSLNDLITIKNIKKKSLNGKFVKAIDENLIKDQGYELYDIIPLDTKIIISGVANVNNGAEITLEDIANIHPDNVAMFKKINKICDLKYNGIDFITYDLSLSYKQYGYFLENNARAGIEGHYFLDKTFMQKFFSLVNKSF